MAVVCVVNRKGGVGKTTLTLALADFLSVIHDRSVLVIDVDPQANASLALLGDDAWVEMDKSGSTIADLFNDAIKRLTQPKAFDPGRFIRQVSRVKGASGKIYMAASSPRLQDAEETAFETLAGWAAYAGSPYMILHHALFAHVTNRYDYVLIDCPPAMGMITLNALTLSSGYVIPTIADYVSTVGLTQVTERVKAHANGLRRKIPLYGTVVNRFRRVTRLHASILGELYGREEAQPIWNTIIPEATRAEGALNQDAGIMTLKQRYGGSDHVLYTSFEALAAEFLRRVS